MKIYMNLIFSKNTIIEIIIALAFFILFNKFIFIALISILLFLVYQSNKTSNFPLPKELENLKMKAFLENPKNTSKLMKDKFIFKDKVDIPHLKSENDILVKIYSSALNQVDYIYQFSQFPLIRWFKMSHFGVGMDFSGKILQVGKNVTKYKIGDEVFGFAKGGSLQEYTLTNENIIFKKPDSISFNEISALPSCFGTAYRSLTYNFGTDVKNKKVLIVGCSGGIGIFAIQISKYLNFEKIVGVCSSRNKNLVESYGVDEVLCYDKENYINDCKEKFDLIFDNVSSPESGLQYEKYKVLLKHYVGEYIVINGTFKQKILGALQLLIGKKFKIEPDHFHFNFGSQDSKFLEIGSKMINEKKLRVLYEPHNFDKKEIISCYEVIESRRTKGKLVIEIKKSD